MKGPNWSRCNVPYIMRYIKQSMEMFEKSSRQRAKHHKRHRHYRYIMKLKRASRTPIMSGWKNRMSKEKLPWWYILHSSYNALSKARLLGSNVENSQTTFTSIWTFYSMVSKAALRQLRDLFSHHAHNSYSSTNPVTNLQDIKILIKTQVAIIHVATNHKSFLERKIWMNYD